MTIPAVVEHNTSGTSTSNGIEFQISHNASTFPFVTIAFSSKTNLNEVNCYQAPASIVVATEHSAGWHVKGLGWVPGRVRTSDYDSCPGPEQPCEDDTQIRNVTYDSYDPYAPSPGSGCDGSGGGENEGSGTQYSPGDYTGGETVDWGTGVGNGGTSACGTTAQVQYVCIDTWNEKTQSWEEWGCGYVTTC